MYNENYNGNVVFYDPDVTDEARRTILDIENDALTYSYDVANEDKYFDDVPDRYKKLIPEVRYEDIRQYIVDEIGDARTKFLNSIKAIENAIIDYCDGDGVISEENKATLDYYLEQNNPSTNPGTNPGPNHGTNSGPSDGTSNSETAEESEESGTNGSDIAEGVNNDYDAQISDEEIVMEQVDGISSGFSEAVIPLLDDDSTGEVASANGIGTSLYSVSSSLNSSDSLVLPTSSVSETGNIDDNDNNELLKTGSISMAAMAALNGKIMYDKKQEKSTDDDETDDGATTEEVSNQEESFSDGMILGTSSVDFKNDLLDQMIEGD